MRFGRKQGLRVDDVLFKDDNGDGEQFFENVGIRY